MGTSDVTSQSIEDINGHIESMMVQLSPSTQQSLVKNVDAESDSTSDQTDDDSDASWLQQLFSEDNDISKSPSIDEEFLDSLRKSINSVFLNHNSSKRDLYIFQ